jgi:hypothetical protein
VPGFCTGQTGPNGPTAAPCNDRPGKRDTSNASDGIARQAGPLSQVALREVADAYQALMIVAVKPG